MEFFDMPPIGFSTGAVAYSHFRAALDLLARTDTTAVELSALRFAELKPLAEAAPSLDLSQYSNVSVHLPSSFDPGSEEEIVNIVGHFPAGWLLVTHPDVIQRWDLWQKLGRRICIENMDKRKPIGQSRQDLLEIFDRLPDATFCFDVGHAHQVDPTMAEAFLILEQFRGKLCELHISEVNSESKHDLISLEAERSFEVVAELIPRNVPVILESRVAAPDEQLNDVVLRRVEREIRVVRGLLSASVQAAAD
jgi:sugar phosphate isomerase/epimerase